MASSARKSTTSANLRHAKMVATASTKSTVFAATVDEGIKAKTAL